MRYKSQQGDNNMKYIIITLMSLMVSTGFAVNWKYVVVDADKSMPWEEVSDAGNWATYDATEDIDAAGYDIEGAGSVTTTNLTIEGGTPTNGAVWTATGTDGVGAWNYQHSKIISHTTQTTNVADIVITGVGFKPRACSIFAAVHNTGDWGSSEGYVDTDGTMIGVNIRGDYTRSLIDGNVRCYYDPGTSDRWVLDFDSFDADGATFSQSVKGSVPTNDLLFVRFIFYR